MKSVNMADLVVDTALDFWTIGQTVAGLVVISHLVSSGIRWSNPSSAAEDLKDEFMNKSKDFPATATVGVLMGFVAGAANSGYPMPFAGFNGMMSGVSVTAAVLWSWLMFGHYSTLFPVTSDQMWAQITAGSVVSGITGGAVVVAARALS